MSWRCSYQVWLLDHVRCWINHIHVRARAAMFIMAAQNKFGLPFDATTTFPILLSILFFRTNFLSCQFWVNLRIRSTALCLDPRKFRQKKLSENWRQHSIFNRLFLLGFKDWYVFEIRLGLEFIVFFFSFLDVFHCSKLNQKHFRLSPKNRMAFWNSSLKL